MKMGFYNGTVFSPNFQFAGPTLVSQRVDFVLQLFTFLPPVGAVVIHRVSPLSQLAE